MNRSLPLFQDLEPHGGHPAGREVPDAPSAGSAVAGRSGSDPGAAARDKHLRAAWRLSRSMKRYRNGSPEQTRAGLAICRHLVASLRQDSAA